MSCLALPCPRSPVSVCDMSWLMTFGGGLSWGWWVVDPPRDWTLPSQPAHSCLGPEPTAGPEAHWGGGGTLSPGILLTCERTRPARPGDCTRPA